MVNSLRLLFTLLVLNLLLGCTDAPSSTPAVSVLPTTRTSLIPTTAATEIPTPYTLEMPLSEDQPFAAGPEEFQTHTPDPNTARPLTETPSQTPTQIDFSVMPPLVKLVISSRYFKDSSVDVPKLLFENPHPRKYDLTSQLEDICGLDCVRRHFVGKNGSLTITLFRYQSPTQAKATLARSWQQFSPDHYLYDTYDEYSGDQDNLWAAKEGTRLAFALTEGPIFVLLNETIIQPPGALDFDAPWYMGELSCLGKLQLSLLVQASSGTLPSILEEPDGCMMWY
jgi:hypothetical protein